MPRQKSVSLQPSAERPSATKNVSGSQTLARGLELIEAVAGGTRALEALALELTLTRSTTHRLAHALVAQRYLTFAPGSGYGLGPKLLELGYVASQQMNLPRIARPYLEKLAADTGDMVHLGVLDGARALYLDKISGRRRVELCSKIGERQPLRSTGLGKALILDEPEQRLRELYNYEDSAGQRYRVDLSEWLRRMRQYAETGIAFDLEENEDRIRCVAAPIRDASRKIVASLSVACAAQYMDDDRMQQLAVDVSMTALAISEELGYRALKPATVKAPPRTEPQPAAAGPRRTKKTAAARRG